VRPNRCSRPQRIEACDNPSRLIQIKVLRVTMRTDVVQFGIAPISGEDWPLTGSPNPAATAHLPFFVTAPGETDVLFNVTVVFVVAIVVLAGVIFLTIHSLPERMAHKSKKIQLDIVAVLCLLALFTHEHAFWFAALLLAFLDIPDFLTPFTRIAASVETIAGQEGEVDSADQSGAEAPEDAIAHQHRQDSKGPVHA
jgi:hypothetical protein